MSDAALLMALCVGIALGAALVWWLMRSRTALALATVANESAVERAMLTERLQATERDLIAAQALGESQRGELQALRVMVDRAHSDVAQLTERASRVPELELVVDRIMADLKGAQLEHLRVARAADERQQAVLDKEKRLQEMDAQRGELEEKLANAQVAVTELREHKAALTAELKAEVANGEQKLAVLSDARESLTAQFQQLASDILEDKSRRFAEQNQSNLTQLLDPLRERIKDFQSKVEEVYVNENKDRSALAEQVRMLTDLNHTVREEARNLTNALKGTNKAQGNWGELVLERVLESSGLRKGHEYELQESYAREDGTRAQPDVVVHLPQDRFLIIDAKVSLTAFEAYVASDDDKIRAEALARHCESVRAHIRGLSPRNYQDLHGDKSFDSVLMFVAVEPAFIAAIANDEDLFAEAWKKNVLLVSPSTLLFALRTIAHLWRQEAQSKNAQAIAERGARLYDKLAAFVEDLERVGERLRQAQDSFALARAKLSTGQGNVIRQAQLLRDLGIKPTKQLPLSIFDGDDSDDAQLQLGVADAPDE